MPSRELLTTCPSPQHSTESQTCRSIYISLSPVPPDPRLLLTSFPNLPKNLAPCWSTPSSDCDNRNVIVSRFETMVIHSSILQKCPKSTTNFENCEISTIIDLLLLCFVVCCMPGICRAVVALNTKVGYTKLMKSLLLLELNLAKI